MRGVLAAVAVLAAAGTAQAAPTLEALGPARAENAPVFAGPHVVWDAGRPAAPGLYTLRRIALRTVPLAGGAGVDLPPITTAPLAAWATAGSATTIAVRTYQDDLVRGSRDQIFASRAGGAFTALPGPVRPTERLSTAGLLHGVTGDDVLELVGQDEIVRHPPAGPPAPVSLPAESQVLSARLAGDLIAVEVLAPGTEADAPVQVALLDARTGAELRRITVPRELLLTEDEFFGSGDLLGHLSVAPDGGVVAGSKANVSRTDRRIGWAPPGADRFLVVTLPRPVDGASKVAASRLAYATRTGDAERLMVVDLPPAAGAATLVWRGPPTTDLTFDDAFDGTHVAWRSATCMLLARLPAPSDPKLPAGPCLRSEATVDYPEEPHGRRFGARIRCLAAPGRACRVEVRARLLSGERFGPARARVPVGARRTVVLRLSRAAARAIRGGDDALEPSTRLVEGSRFRVIEDDVF